MREGRLGDPQLPDLGNQVEVVVARGGVGANAHRDPGIQQRADARAVDCRGSGWSEGK